MRLFKPPYLFSHNSYVHFLSLTHFAVLLHSLWGCSYRVPWEAHHARISQEIPIEISNSISIDDEKHRYEKKLVNDHDSYQVYRVKIFQQDEDSSPMTQLLWYHSKKSDTKRPVDFMWPILVGKHAPVAKLLATTVFVKQGMDALIIEQTEKIFGEKDKPRSFEDLMTFHQEMVRHFLRAVQWAQQQPLFDRQRFGLTGTSYGGILTMICMPFAEDFVSFKMIMAGGELTSIILNSAENKVIRWKNGLLRQIQEENNHQLSHSEAMAIFKKRLTTHIENFALDPKHLALFAKPARCAQIITRYDRSVPTANQLLLWKNLGYPEALFVNTGHYTLAIAFFQVKSFIEEITIKHYRL